MSDDTKSVYLVIGYKYTDVISPYMNVKCYGTYLSESDAMVRLNQLCNCVAKPTNCSKSYKGESGIYWIKMMCLGLECENNLYSPDKL